MNERITRAPYRREPYVRLTLRDGSTLDGKALAWTRDRVLFHNEGGETVADYWVPASAVVRIDRADSRWQDPYDDVGVSWRS